MKRLVGSALCFALLGACQTTAGAPPVGASELQLEPARYRVTFRGVSGASEPEVQDRALLHAANLALMRGASWFRIADRGVGIAPPTSPRISLGIGGASFGRGSVVGGSVGHSFGGEGTYVATLEVVLGMGPRPPGPDVYDARAIVDTLGPRLAPPSARR